MAAWGKPEARKQADAAIKNDKPDADDTPHSFWK